MKIFSGLITIILTSLFISGCNVKGGGNKESQSADDIISVPDTGFTGIKQYMSGQVLIKEVTFKNGVREGLMKSFYQTGEVRQTFTYMNGLREDSARWFYQEGQVFRTTPYLHDTIDGIQKQFYRNGRIKAKLGYIKGFRTPYLEEFTPDGKLVGGYSQLLINTKDDFNSKGIYKVILELSDKSTKVKYYRGDLSKGIFDTAQCKKINTINGIGYLDLRKTGSPKTGYVEIIAEVLTNFGNKNLIFKRIELPYKNLD